jgi:uncharacterized phiE125 gp8 family phage protein
VLAPVLVTAPASAIVTVAEAKAHMAVDHVEDDALIGSLIDAATAHLDGWTGVLGRALVTQTWRQSFPCFQDMLRLRLGPVASITSVGYVDPARATQTASSSLYTLLADDLGAFVWLKEGATWPSTIDEPDAVTVTYVAGVAAAAVPKAIRQAILLLAGQWYRSREATGDVAAVELPFAVSALIAPYRRVGV